MDKISIITSRDNPRLARIRKVRDGRETEEVFAEGIRLCEEVLRTGLRVFECAVTPEARDSERVRAILNAILERGGRVNEVPEVLLKSIADTAHPQGLIVTAERPRTGADRMRSIDSSPILIFLEKISDPSNLGAIFRTAEAAGVSGVILSPGSADPFSPKALRSSLGSSLRVPVWDKAELKEFVEWASQEGIRILGADITGKVSYLQVDLTDATAFVMGSEAHGLTDEHLDLMSEVITIPMQNGVESLNLAVSTGILLYEAVRQRMN